MTPADLEAIVRRVLREELARLLPQRSRQVEEPVQVTPAASRAARDKLREKGYLHTATPRRTR